MAKKFYYKVILHFIILIGLLFFYKCPIKLLFNIACPGCGFTRAIKCLFKFDFIGAFEYYPLCFLIVIEMLYLLLRPIYKLNRNIETILFVFTIIGIWIVYFIRLYTHTLPV